MRTFQLFLGLALMTLLGVACENGNNNDLPNNPVEQKCYKGTMVVDQNDGTFYTQEDVEVDFEIKDGKLNFVMCQVKFAKGMPLKLDMVVEGADYVDNDGSYTISGDGIIPYAMGGPFEKFTITKLNGTITDTEFEMEFMCGEYPVTYAGTK
ncbi:MAG: hypothetical protein J6C56_08935 [Alistipes sp.]|nr:hypothetical protein [Alistipes sp.]